MPQYKAPGVYIEEVERGAKSIEGVGTSTPGFLGETERGPEDPRLVTSFADYRRLFGGPVEDRYLSHAVEGFFQNGGSRCYIGRVTPEETATGEVNLPAHGTDRPDGELVARTETVDFGRIAGNQTRTLDAVVAAEETATITAVRLTGSRRDDFDVPDDLVPDEGLVVEAGSQERIEVTFDPGGESSGDNPTLEIDVAGDATADDVTLEGVAVEHDLGSSDLNGELGYTPGLLDFETVPVGETVWRTVTLQNLGSEDIELADPAIELDDDTEPFDIAEQATLIGETIDGGETLPVEVSTTPSDANGFSTALTVNYNEGNSSEKIELTGTAVFTDEFLDGEAGETEHDGELTTATDATAFGTVVAGNVHTVTVHNRGTTEIQLTDIGSFDSFTVLEREAIEDGDVTVSGGDSYDLSFRIDPGETGEVTESANLSFTDASGSNQTLTLELDATILESIIELLAVGPGNWAEGLAVTVEDGSLYRSDENHFFRVFVRYWSDPEDREAAQAVLADPDADIDEAPDPDAEEVYDNLTIDPESSDYYGTTLDGNSMLVQVNEAGSENTARPANGTYWFGGDFENNDVAPRHFDGDAAEPADRTGFAAFGQVDEIAMVCVPDEHEYDDPLADDIVDHCTSMGDRFAILQSPPNPPPPGSLRPTENSDFAAFYYPWLTIGDPETGRDMDVPPGGHVAGIYARSDQERGVHKAPANEQVRGIRSLQKTVSKGDQETLNPRGVNCIRTFRGRGTRVWGARTTSSDPAWKYVNVRRLFLFVEESIEEGTQWVVFEPNDEKLWARVRQTIRNFLTSVWQDGALMGSTAEEAFYVKCDRSTMTQNDIDNGRLICEIGIAPVKPAEFVVFRISQTTAGGEG